MAKKMLAYLEEQPEIWIRMIEDRDRLFGDFIQMIRTRNINRIVLIGTGSSYNACEIAQVLFEEVTGIETTSVIPTRLGKLFEFLDPNETLVLTVSQSGSSTSTAKVAAELREKDFFLIGVTAEPESRLAKQCDFHQLISCGEESVGPKTKGMTATILTLYLMGIALGRKRNHINQSKEDELLETFRKAFEAAPENIKRSRIFCDKHKEIVSAKPDFTLIGDGMSFPAAKEGALKILETLYVPCGAYEFEEYLHGVNNTIEPGVCNILVPSMEENLTRMILLDQFCRNHGCTDFVITTLPWALADYVLQLQGTGSQYTIPFEVLLPLQVISVYGSEQKGIECDKPKFKDFYSVMGTKHPIET